MNERPPVIANLMFNKRQDKLKNRELKDLFTYARDTNLWASEESVSGVGSELKATELIRRELPRLFADLNIRSILDVPCGDYTWMKELDLSVSYTGADIVDDIVALNNEKHSVPGAVDFVSLDLTRDVLPDRDLILCRDCLVHLSFSNVFAALKNMVGSGADYLLMTSFTSLEENRDILNGDWRPLNFVKKPFEFPPPMAVIVEGCVEEDGAYADKSLCLWKTKDLKI